MDRPLRFLVPLGVLLAAYFALVGAAQLPETALQLLVAGWLLPAAIFLSASQHKPPHGWDLWFLLLGPFLVWYYIWRTRRERSSGTSAVFAAIVLSPAIGMLMGSLAAWLVPLPPRYVQLREGGPTLRITAALADSVAHSDFRRIAAFLRDEQARGRSLPADVDDLYRRLGAAAREATPFDLFTGGGYYYERRDEGYVLWSAGRDRLIGTDDDPWFIWPELANDSGVPPN
jgi:hypothetical protein